MFTDTNVRKPGTMNKVWLILFTLVLFAISGCNKIADVEPGPTMYDLSFNIRAGQAPGGLKETPTCINETKTASYVEVTLLKQGDITASTIKLDVFYISGQPYTNSMKLVPGTYTIQEFIMRNDNMTPDNLADDPVIAAAVHTGAPYANLVTSWLTKDFTISPFKKNLLEVELVCYDEANFTSFGFEYFQIDQTVIREQNFFGDLCIRNVNAYYNSPYSSALGGNTNLMLDLPAIFQIEVLRNGISIGTYNNNSVTGISKPLKIAYADRLNTNDNFELKLSVMVLSGSVFQYEYFHSWTFQDAQKIPAGTDGIVDFVLGSCVPDADLIIPYSGPENAAPVANNVGQSGNPQAGQVFTGSYIYYDAEGDLQGATTYKWYRADDAGGTNETLIIGMTGSTYTLQAADLNKFIRFAVIPVALTGTLQGTEVKAPVYSGPVITAPFSCGSSITINHVAGDVAPVTKTVTYGTVTNIPGEPSKCWITRNLGANQQATGKDDATEASAGWYWQFNRKQGYKHDGSIRTPNSTWSSISESSDWNAANDPCLQTLGDGWRLPTITEWTNVDAIGNWTSRNDSWDSDLKMHAAGNLQNWNGLLLSRGSEGSYWSSSQNIAGTGKFMFFSSKKSYVDFNGNKSSGFAVRCLKNN